MSPPLNPRAVKTARLVLAAIDDLGHNKGASMEAIADHIENELSVPNKDFGRYLNKAIESGIAFGAIKKLRGRYYLGDILDHVRTHRRRRRRRSRSRRRRGGRRRRRRRRRL